jgi:hypothetical protein
MTKSRAFERFGNLVLATASTSVESVNVHAVSPV